MFSIITTECVVLRNEVLATLNGFSNMEIEGNSKVIINCYIKKNSLHTSITFLMEDIWGLAQNLNIYNCCNIYRKANRITYCLVKKGICNTNLVIWWSKLPRDVRNLSLKIIVNLLLIEFVEFFIRSLHSQNK